MIYFFFSLSSKKFFFFLMIRRPPRSTLFPYTTLISLTVLFSMQRLLRRHCERNFSNLQLNIDDSSRPSKVFLSSGLFFFLLNNLSQDVLSLSSTDVFFLPDVICFVVFFLDVYNYGSIRSISLKRFSSSAVGNIHRFFNWIRLVIDINIVFISRAKQARLAERRRRRKKKRSTHLISLMFAFFARRDFQRQHLSILKNLLTNLQM